MTTLQAILLGVLQGLTEFLPVSSSGHLVLAQQFLGIEVPILFDILLHVATLAAVIVVFRTRILAILVSLVHINRKNPSDEDRLNRRLFLWLLVASVFTGVLGVSISYLQVETLPKVVSVLFVVTGLILLASRNRGGEIGYAQIGWKQAIITGIAQGISVFPGISRSGTTISAALFAGMRREDAGEFSFLLVIPAILGALVLKIRESHDLMNTVSPLALTAGLVASFVVGLLALVVLLRLVRKGKLYFFSFYLIPLGVITFFLV